MSKLVYLKDVVTLQLDTEKCVGCGMCLQVCPHAVFAMDQDKVRIQDRNACMECGACAQNCPVEALFVETGVGCAAAVINAALGRTDSVCCDISNQKSVMLLDGLQAPHGGPASLNDRFLPSLQKAEPNLILSLRIWTLTEQI